MSREEIIAHWRKGAFDALEMAQLALKAEKFDHALFNCELAVEKALKAAHMVEHDTDAPHTHDLQHLAGLLRHTFSNEDIELLKRLSNFAVEARYNDPEWAQRMATKENAEHWIHQTDLLLSHLLS